MFKWDIVTTSPLYNLLIALTHPVRKGAVGFTIDCLTINARCMDRKKFKLVVTPHDTLVTLVGLGEFMDMTNPDFVKYVEAAHTSPTDAIGFLFRTDADSEFVDRYGAYARVTLKAHGLPIVLTVSHRTYPNNPDVMETRLVVRINTNEDTSIKVTAIKYAAADGHFAIGATWDEYAPEYTDIANTNH